MPQLWLWRRVALLTGIVCIGSCLFSCGLGYGLVYRTQQTYQEQYLKERELLEPLLASDPAFAGLECSRRSAGGVDLVGVVPAQSDRERLSERIIRLVGEPRARELMVGVSVARQQFRARLDSGRAAA